MTSPQVWCETCHNTGEVDCGCGGDLCVCGGLNGDGTNPCPKCGGECGERYADDGRFDDFDDFEDFGR